MTRSLLDLSIISSAMTAADGVVPAVGAGPAGDRESRRSTRQSRSLGPLLALLAWALVVVAGWAVVRGEAALDPGRSATPAAGAVCESALCDVTRAPANEVLPPEWRYEKKGYVFEHMFRKAPPTARVAESGSSRR